MSDSKPQSLSILLMVTGPAPVESLHEELCTHLDEIVTDYEILYLVGTAASTELSAVRALCERNPERVRVLEFSQALGEAAMLSAGASQARSDVLMTIPGRYEVDFSCLRQLHAAIVEGADLALAARTSGGDTASARAQSEVFNKIVSRATGSSFDDVASGTRAMHRRVLEEIPLYGEFHRYLPVLAERSGFSVVELRVPVHPLAKAPAVHSPRVYLWRAMDVLAVMFVSRFTRHPLRLFGGVGAVFAAAGSVILAVVGIERMLGTPLANRPVLVLAVLMIGLGVQAFTIGLLGELILFFRARSIRDYRVGAIHESQPPPLPENRADDGPETDRGGRTK